MTTSNKSNNDDRVFLRYPVRDRETDVDIAGYDSYTDSIFKASHSHKCPTYVQRTPPCQNSCPSGHDVRSWLNIINRKEKPSGDFSVEEYAFQRATSSNPFPSIMGRVCPAPCEGGCNRSDVETPLGINSLEQYIGDNALEENYSFTNTATSSGKKVAIIGGGPGGLSSAFFLTRLGHHCTIFESSEKLGGMIRYGIPGYRVPDETLDQEIKRIIDLGVEVKLNTKVGSDISVDSLEQGYDAIYWAIGAQQGKSIPITGIDAPNVVSGVEFLRAYNDGKLQHVTKRIIVIGGGDTSIDVASVARRLGTYTSISGDQLPERVIANGSQQKLVDREKCTSPNVLLTSILSEKDMPASQHEIDDAVREGVALKNEVGPKEILLDENGNAIGAIFHQLKFENKKFIPVEGSEFEVKADLIVLAIGQTGVIDELPSLSSTPGLFKVDANFQVLVDREIRTGHFAGGDIVNPHLLTTAIGHSRITAQSIHDFINNKDLPKRRPKVDANIFDLPNKLSEFDLSPEVVTEPILGTDSMNVAIHNYENRASSEVVNSSEQFLGHFRHVNRTHRNNIPVDDSNVLGNFEERRSNLSKEEAMKESSRCMSCGICFECDNCVIYCPQKAVSKTKRSESTTGRYVETDYNKCIGCHICKDVCPTSYIQMGLGE